MIACSLGKKTMNLRHTSHNIVLVHIFMHIITLLDLEYCYSCHVMKHF